MYDLVAYSRTGTRVVVATFRTMAEAVAVRNGYLACGTTVCVVRR